MTMINRPCDYCGKKDNPVYERYQVQTGTSIKLKPHELVPGRWVPENMTYWCDECANKERKIINATVSIS